MYELQLQRTLSIYAQVIINKGEKTYKIFENHTLTVPKLSCMKLIALIETTAGEPLPPIKISAHFGRYLVKLLYIYLWLML